MEGPSRTKFRKQQKKRNRRLARDGRDKLASLDYGIKALGWCMLSGRRLEACRVALSRAMNRVGTVLLRVFPQKPITKKPAEVRMGKGKGGVDHYAAVIKPGAIIFEIGGVSKAEAREAIWLTGKKLPIKTKMVMRTDYI
jgi:large subunit ribosomal protein L16